jgi:hypothetical protein
MCCTAAEAEGHFQLAPSVGDMLWFSIFCDTAACRDEFTATNTKTVTVATPCQVIYRHAPPGATLTDISSNWWSRRFMTASLCQLRSRRANRMPPAAAIAATAASTDTAPTSRSPWASGSFPSTR